MKLEVGMYVRTNEGIGTVQRIYNNKNDCTVRFKKGHVKKWVTILKASHNIIDLIGEGDYVNGFRVDAIGIYQSIKTGVETYAAVDCSALFNCFYEEDIKSIVTKEQFESMSYKVGE